MNISAIETIIINRYVVSVNFINVAPLLGVAFESDGFESDPEEEEEGDVETDDDEEVEAEVGVDWWSWPSVVGDVVEFESASLKIFASGEFGGSFRIPSK